MPYYSYIPEINKFARVGFNETSGLIGYTGDDGTTYGMMDGAYGVITWLTGYDARMAGAPFDGAMGAIYPGILVEASSTSSTFSTYTTYVSTSDGSFESSNYYVVITCQGADSNGSNAVQLTGHAKFTSGSTISISGNNATASVQFSFAPGTNDGSTISAVLTAKVTSFKVNGTAKSKITIPKIIVCMFNGSEVI